MPDALDALNRWCAAATIAHEIAFELHRELVGLGVADGRTRALLKESAALSQVRMPALTRPTRALGRERDAQELLDPAAAAQTIELLEAELEEITPEIVALRTRQDEIVYELSDLVRRAR